MHRGITNVYRPPLDASTVSYISAMSVLPTRARMKVLNTFIIGLKVAGIWDQIDTGYILWSHDNQAARLNFRWPGRFTATTSGGPTFTVDRGYTGDGAASRLLTNWVPSTNGVNYVQDSASAWVYVLTSVDDANYDTGNTSGTGRTQILSRTAAGNINVMINDATAAAVATASSIGFTGAQRRGATDKRLWKDGAQAGSTLNTASTAVPTAGPWICGSNGTVFSTRQIGFVMYGGAMAGLEASLNSLVVALGTGIGAI